MTCFEVYLNGRLVCTAGLDDFGMLTAGVRRTRQHPNTLARLAAAGFPQPAVAHQHLSVTGHVDAGRGGTDSLAWADEPVAVGDEIVIRVVERDECDPAGEDFDDDPAPSDDGNG